MLAIGIVIILFVFRVVFTKTALVGYDWPVLFRSSLQKLPIVPQAWSTLLNNGLGGSTAPLLWVDAYYQFIFHTVEGIFGVPFGLTERIFYIGPALITAAFGSYTLVYSLAKRRLGAVVGMIVFCTNTYILMLFSGGQLNIVFSYALIPTAFLSWIHILDRLRSDSRPSVRSLMGSIAAFSLAFAFIVIDTRIAYATAIGLILYTVFSLLADRMLILSIIKRLLPVIYILAGLQVLLQAFWILPILSSHGFSVARIASVTATNASLAYFSFGTFSQSLSLLHPNWPENIFGKVYFFRPEFLLIALIVYLPLLLITNTESQKRDRFRRILLSFSGIALIMAFLAKGTAGPAGFLYGFLYRYIPGFNLFRDPTKFYSMIALSYTVLIGLSVVTVRDFLTLRGIGKFRIIRYAVLCVFILLWGFSIRQSITGSLSGIMKPIAVPRNYSELADILSRDKTFSRVLWIPDRQRYGFSSTLHPAVDAYSFLNAPDATSSATLLVRTGAERLRDWGIGYVVIPDDLYGDFFADDRRYDASKYASVVRTLDAAPWLTGKRSLGRIIVYSVTNLRPQFTLTGTITGMKEAEFMQHTPTSYSVSVRTDAPARLVFNQSFDPAWVMTDRGVKIQARETEDHRMWFPIDKRTTAVTVSYALQASLEVGLALSLMTAGVLIFAFLNGKKRENP